MLAFVRLSIYLYFLDNLELSKRHLSERISENLNLKSFKNKKNKSLNNDSAIVHHILSCGICQLKLPTANKFKIIKKCRTACETKIHEAIMIKRYKPKLKRQLHKSGVSFLLNVFKS